MDIRETITKLLRDNKKIICELKDIKGSNNVSSVNTSSLPESFSISSLTYENNNLTLTYKEGNTTKSILVPILNSNPIKQNVEYYNQLVSGTSLYELAYVKKDIGTKWLPGSLGGTYYPFGIYLWDGNKWVKENEQVFKGIQEILDKKSTMMWESEKW
jgi:hypothetical protein